MNTFKNSICQSCGMPLRSDCDFGTEKDTSLSIEYCFHCYQGGRFLDEEITLEDKIEKNVKFGIQMGMTETEVRRMCYEILPKLKRWQKKQ